MATANSGVRAFYVDQDGDVWQTANVVPRYSGLGFTVPVWDAALPAGTGYGRVAMPKGPSHTGRDGNVWGRTN